MPSHYRDYLDELFIDKLSYEADFSPLAKPDIPGVDNLLSLSRDYVHGNVSVIVAECRDKQPVFQKALIKSFKGKYPDAHFLFISNDGKVFDLYNYSTSKKLKAITYNELDKNTRLFKEKVQFFNATSAGGSADLKVQIDRAFETSDRLTKKFYDKFKGIHDTLTKGIKGIADDADRSWYATTLLNRLMFIFFLQKSGVLQGDIDFLLAKYDVVRARGGDYFHDFLLPLFFKGFAKRDGDVEKEAFTAQYGPVKYLNGGLFYPNKIEMAHASVREEMIGRTRVQVPDATAPTIRISNAVILEVIKFLNGYSWYLDNRPAKDETEINPDVLGYIFEKYINQKELGAYYTKEDITGYISRSTIIPFVWDKMRRAGHTAPDPTPAITANEDLAAMAERWIERLDDYDALKYLYADVLTPLSVLDPAVGSGAFLFAALQVLLPLYQSTVARLKTFKGTVKDRWLDALLKTLSEHPEEYYLTKHIILHNLYGVDIVEEGVEICKLRLFLQLASHLADIQSIEPLPDIDFNIYSGNSLVGGLSYADLKGTYAMRLFDRDGQAFDEDELKRAIDALQTLKREYKAAQAGEDDAALRRMKAALAALEARINHTIDVGIENPFHWFVDFAEIFERGGFDVVVGNPPYVEYSKVREDYVLQGYRTIRAGNLYAYFIERVLGISQGTMRLGLIVPISMACTKRMGIIQNVVFENAANSWWSFYAERPDKLFVGADLSLCILLTERGEKAHAINTTRYIKWNANEREQLFERLEYANSKSLVKAYSIPKVGTALETGILNKLSKNKTSIGSYVVPYSEFSVCFRNAGGRYFKIVLDHEPTFWMNNKEVRSSTYKFLFFENKRRRDALCALMNSSLFFWHWTVYSDTWHMVNEDVVTFPVELTSALEKDLAGLNKKLMKDFLQNAEHKTEYRNKGKDIIQYSKFFAKRSKPIIDEIDSLLANHYGFSGKEESFIKNYDLHLRVGSDDEG